MCVTKNDTAPESEVSATKNYMSIHTCQLHISTILTWGRLDIYQDNSIDMIQDIRLRSPGEVTLMFAI